MNLHTPLRWKSSELYKTFCIIIFCNAGVGSIVILIVLYLLMEGRGICYFLIFYNFDKIQHFNSRSDGEDEIEGRGTQ